MAMNLLTSGQTTGLTQIPNQTICRYIKQFPEFFSQDAKKKTKGRRFNGKDIKTLLLIRNLKASHSGNEKIKAILQGEITLPEIASLDQNNALKLFDAARKEIKGIKEINYQSIESLKKTEYLTKRFTQSIEKVNLVYSLISRIEELETKLNTLNQKIIYQEMNKGFLAKIFS